MESTNNQTPARSSEEQLKAKYGGKLYRVGITVPVDDESEKDRRDDENSGPGEKSFHIFKFLSCTYFVSCLV